MPQSPATAARERDRAFWFSLAGVVVVSALVRVAFFSGFFGSDEVTYALHANDIANGTWNRTTYVGSLRYGINLPSALFIKLFGASEFSANLWALMCSVGEVTLVFAFAHRLWGLRAALLSATIIGLLPLHVNYGGRLLADAPLAFFITLSMILFWIAERRQTTGWYLAAGLTVGFVFWIKELVLVPYGMVFVLYALVYRRWNFKWLWAGGAAVLVVGANSLLMWMLQGDPLHVFRIVRAVTDRYAHEFSVVTSPWFYIKYLFFNLKHMWIMGHLAAGGVVLWAWRMRAQRSLDDTTSYVVLWGLGLAAIFSFMPISFNPLTLVAKQINYMLIFTAPLCMLAGYFLAALSRRWLAGLFTVYAAGGITLSGLEQQAVHVFTANSKATVELARAHRPLPVYAGSNAGLAELYSEMLRSERTGSPSIITFDSLIGRSEGVKTGDTRSGLQGYAVLDLETAAWRRDALRRLQDVPECWRRLFELEPYAENAPGYYIAKAILWIARLTPEPVSSRLTPRLEGLVRPRPAYVYAIPAGCVFSPPAATKK